MAGLGQKPIKSKQTARLPKVRAPRDAQRHDQQSPGQAVNWQNVLYRLQNLALKNLDPTKYAIEVRRLYDVVVERTGDDEEMREFLSFQLRVEQAFKHITPEYLRLAIKLLPKPPARKKGRRSGALGEDAHALRYKLYQDWTRERALNPHLTKEQFAKKRLSISDAELEDDFDLDDPDADGPLRKKVAALLQELKPARMKQLDRGDRDAIDAFPFDITYPEYLALKWREAKRISPRLTKKDFLQHEIFKWPRKMKRHPSDIEMLDRHLKQLNRGEEQIGDRPEASIIGDYIKKAGF
jgi:hypothetical protein